MAKTIRIVVGPKQAEEIARTHRLPSDMTLKIRRKVHQAFPLSDVSQVEYDKADAVVVAFKDTDAYRSLIQAKLDTYTSYNTCEDALREAYIALNTKLLELGITNYEILSHGLVSRKRGQ